MAIFRDVSEVSRTSGYTKPFERTTGWRKAGLAALGYNDKGERNLWGHLNPMSYAAPGLQHMYAKGLATGDTDKVLGENTSDAIGAQLSSLSLASNFIPGVGIAGKMGISAGLGVAKGINNNSKQESTDAVTSAAGTALVQKTLQEASKDRARKSMEDGIEDLTNQELMKDEDYSSAIDSTDEGTAAIGKEAFLQKNGEVLNAAGGDEAMGSVGGAAKGAKFASGAMTALSIAGDAAEVVQSQMNYNKGLKNSKKKIMKQSVISPGAQNYL